jgi:hypothetical protein
MDVIWHRLGSKESALALTGIDHIGLQLAHKNAGAIRAGRAGAL